MCFGHSTFLEDAVCRRTRKETWLLLVCFLSLSAPRGSYYGQYLWAWLVCGTDSLALQGSLLQHGQSPQEGDWPLSLSHCLPLFSGLLWIDTVPYGSSNGSLKLPPDCSGPCRNVLIPHNPLLSYSDKMYNALFKGDVCNFSMLNTFSCPRKYM